MKERIACATLGCRLNQFESDSLLSQFQEQGYPIVSFHDHADVYILNTCSVTNKSDAKSRNLISRFHRKNPNALMIVTGCYAQTDAETLAQMPGVDYVVPNEKKHDIFQLVTGFFNKRPLNICDMQDDVFQFHCTQSLRTRSYVKIQDGCNEGCSYCKIPLSRGQAQSRNYGQTYGHVRELLARGHKELILTGVNIGEYSSNGVAFHDLLWDLLQIEGDFRLHISSIEPNRVTRQVIALFSHPKLCQHLHLPLQSGSSRILKQMNRKYTREEFEDVVARVREVSPMMNVTTDVMVGFPGETDEDFQETLGVIQALGLTHAHTFKYSIRNNTPAASFSNHVDELVKSERSASIRENSLKLQRDYAQRFVGKSVRVLAEAELRPGMYTGYSDHYLRVNYYAPNARLAEFHAVSVSYVDSAATLMGVLEEPV